MRELASQHPCMQLLKRENQIPILAPDDVAVLNGEAAELAGVEVLVVLWVGMAADELADVHCLHGVVAERQADSQVACVPSENLQIVTKKCGKPRRHPRPQLPVHQVAHHLFCLVR